MTTALAVIGALGCLGIFLHCTSVCAGEIIYGEIEGDGPTPGAEKFPLIAAAAIIAYLALAHLILG
jgi:hypothetical protein